MDIDGKTYFVTNETNGDIYNVTEDDDIGEKVGTLVDGSPQWIKKKRATKKK